MQEEKREIISEKPNGEEESLKRSNRSRIAFTVITFLQYPQIRRNMGRTKKGGVISNSKEKSSRRKGRKCLASINKEREIRRRVITTQAKTSAPTKKKRESTKKRGGNKR